MPVILWFVLCPVLMLIFVCLPLSHRSFMKGYTQGYDDAVAENIPYEVDPASCPEGQQITVYDVLNGSVSNGQ